MGRVSSTSSADYRLCASVYVDAQVAHGCVAMRITTKTFGFPLLLSFNTYTFWMICSEERWRVEFAARRALRWCQVPLLSAPL